MINEPNHILLADDDPRDLEMIIEALRASNLANKIDVVRDGVEVLDYLHRRNKFAGREGDNPILLILDLKLPKMDGLTTIQRLRQEEHFQKIPVMILTASNAVQDFDLSDRFGANIYLVKPVFAEGFLFALKKLGLCWTVADNPANAGNSAGT